MLSFMTFHRSSTSLSVQQAFNSAIDMLVYPGTAIGACVSVT
jgi:hypothetical protein